MSDSNKTLLRILQISTKLKSLYVEQDNIGRELDKFSEELRTMSSVSVTTQATNKTETKERSVTLEECRLHIGERVRIINPRRIKDCFGKINQGTMYIMVCLADRTVH